MKALDKKLFRDYLRLWAQSLAIGLVLACGVAMTVIGYGAERSLSETQETFYERNRFADIFASATRAPNTLKEEIEQISGVSIVETRISQYAILDIEGLVEPAVGRLLSLPKSGEPVLNLPSIIEGRLPSPTAWDEVAVNENFALANEFEIGDGFYVTINGQKRWMTIVGTALSPEFIYTVSPGGMMPDDLRFGILWIGYDVLAAAFELQGAFNDVSLKMTLDANELAVKDELENLLAPYGGSGAFGRDMQASHSMLEGELEGLRAMSKVLPPLFFVISAFLVGMVLGRLITLEREQIGLFKAIGYTSFQIAVHYVKLAIGIGFFGIMMGWGLGGWAGYELSFMYAEYFHFPYLIYITSPDVFAISGIAGVITAIVGASRSVLRVTRLSPAVAMSPPAPTRFRQNVFDNIGHFFHARQPLMMIIRSLTRWPVRAILTTLGISLSVAIYISSAFMFDAMEELIDASFFQSNRQQATFSLAMPQTRAVLSDAENLPGVLRAEGMRSVAVRLTNGHLSRLIAVEGREPDMDLSRVLDADDNRVVFPDKGIVLSSRLAEHLHVLVGDILVMEVLQGQRGTFEVPVTGIITQFFGMGAYMDLDFLSALIQQQPMINAIHVSLDGVQINQLYEAVKVSPNIGGMVLWSQIRKSFDETIGESTALATMSYVIVASLIVIGVVYNSARIQLSERARELASLRILGFTRGEVSFILMGELMFLTVLAIPLGFVIGTIFASGIVTSFSSDLYSIPLIITRETYAMSGIIVFVASAASALLVRRRVNNLDLVAVMKTRE